MKTSLFPKMTHADIHLWLNCDKPLFPAIVVKINDHDILASISVIARGYQVNVYDGPDKVVFALSSPDLYVCKKAAQEVVETLVGSLINLTWKESSQSFRVMSSFYQAKNEREVNPRVKLCS